MPPPPSVVLDPAAIPDVTELTSPRHLLLTSPRHLPDETELALLLSAVELQRQAWQQLQQLRGGAPALLRAMVLRELSGGEAAAGLALHAVVAETGGSEAIVRRAAACLASAQQLYEELGELAQVRLMTADCHGLKLALSGSCARRRCS